MKKGTFGLIGILLAVNLLALVSAADVAYVALTNDYVRQEFIDVLDELSLSYDLVFSNQISDYDFSSVELMLINNDFFTNWDEIPVNDVPALIVNGRNINDWGWTTMVSSASQNSPLHINLASHAITEGLDEDIQVYTDDEPDIYYLDSMDIFNGLQILGSTTFDEEVVVWRTVPNKRIITRINLYCCSEHTRQNKNRDRCDKYCKYHFMQLHNSKSPLRLF